MVEYDAQKLHSLELDMALEVKRICELKNISYFLIAGSLLGAVRHKGFIPWDDDIDIGMLRSDYERFLDACKTELDSEKYFIQTMQNDDGYGHSFGKLRLKGTVFLESMTESASEHHEIFLDIFPFDNVPEGKLARKIHGKSIYIKKHLLWSKMGYDTKPTGKSQKLLYGASGILSKLFTKKGLKKSLEKSLKKYNSKQTSCVVTNGSYRYEKETLKREWTQDLVEHKFENTTFMGAKDYDGYLTHLYGDYMQLPPEDKRYDKHMLLKIDFGKY